MGITNAINFYNENRNKPVQQQNDVYGLLKSFIKNNPHLDVFVDECPILWNPKTFKYDKGSLTRLENLLTECQSMMLPFGASLWIALQSNNLQDYGAGYPEDWNDLVN